MQYKNASTPYTFKFAVQDLHSIKHSSWKLRINKRFRCNTKFSQWHPQHAHVIWPWDLLCPCKHIFALRKWFKLCLFEQNLCGRRLKRGVEMTKAVTTENANAGSLLRTNRLTTSKILSKKQKQLCLAPILKNIFYSTSCCPQPVYEMRLKLLRTIREKFLTTTKNNCLQFIYTTLQEKGLKYKIITLAALPASWGSTA